MRRYFGPSLAGTLLLAFLAGCSSESGDTGDTIGGAGPIGGMTGGGMAGAGPTYGGATYGGATYGGATYGGATMGGMSSGGMSSGGMSSGGMSSGGMSSGGATSGGTASGGVAGRSGRQSGGSSSGGAADGGSPSGGMSSGGMSSGGMSSGGATSGGSSSGGSGQTLPKFVGNITTNGQPRSDLATYWDQVTPENEGKWGSVQGSQGSWNWGGLDNAYDYAEQNNIIFKEHCFVWGSQQPSWVNSSNGEDAVRTWMQTFCERYPNTPLIDVVNEPPPHTTPAYKDGIGGDGSSGYDWIANAFKWAREFCPNAILILNDYNTIEYGNDNSNIIKIANAIKGAGAPIDAVGCQAHAAYSMSDSSVQGYLDNIASQTGLPLYITEYDIDVADDNQQKSIMESQMTMFLNDDDIKGITLWGYIVGATWLSNSGLMTSGGQMRPAMTWLMDYLGR